ncbi:hypothetical protein ACFVH4_13070 [Nocardia ignorata]|uniref:hypothetical protein n=1 Tax=Nocardia ignorata TaxID=145285 RepID=UPI00362C53AE
MSKTLKELVGNEVDPGDFAATVGQVRQVAWVSIHGKYSTTRQCGTAEPSRERSAAGPGLQALRSRTHAQSLSKRDAFWVVGDSQQCTAFVSEIPLFVWQRVVRILWRRGWRRPGHATTLSRVIQAEVGIKRFHQAK